MGVLDLILIIVSFLWVASEMVLQFTNRAKDSSQDRSSLMLLMIINYLCTFVGVFIAISKGPGNIFWGVPLLHYLGITLITFGLILRWTAIFTLKRQFTVKVSIVENHQMIDHGIYHYVRHPAYLGSLISFLGLALYFGNWISFIIIFLPTLGAHLYRIAIEETVLKTQFGQKYLDYTQKTSRLIPKIY